MAFSVLFFNDPKTGARAKVQVIAAEDKSWEVRIDSDAVPLHGGRTRISWGEVSPFIGWDRP